MPSTDDAPRVQLQAIMPCRHLVGIPDSMLLVGSVEMVSCECGDWRIVRAAERIDALRIKDYRGADGRA